MNSLKIKQISVQDLIPYINNARVHTELQVAQIAASIKEFGFNNPILTDGDNGVIAGHGRLLAAKKLDIEKVPAVELSHLSETQKKAYILADNRLAELASWDDELVRCELDALSADGFDGLLTGFDFEDDGGGGDAIGGSEPIIQLKDRFVVPPFSILDTRQGYWQDRKKAWKAKINDNGESRENTLFKSSGDPVSDKLQSISNGVSVLDPVLAEISIKWFGINDGHVFDCFAGDSVFGYVSSHEGQVFTGIELRKEQVDLNNQRVLGFPRSKYICDDGQNVALHIEKESQDLLFSCPPYFDLEVYSDIENDASNQGTYAEFIDILKKAFTDSIKCLKENRFAFIVVGDVRDKKTGGYYGFQDDIKMIFNSAGMMTYNELILVEAAATAALRAGPNMKSRKVVKTHQNVLVFYKGDTSKIKENFPEIPREELEIESEDME